WLLLGRFLFQVNDIDSAEAAYRQAMALEDPKLRPVTRELADQLFDRQMMDACVEYYRELHKLDKSDTRVALRLAEVLLRRQDLEGAQEVLRHVDVEPTSTPSFHLLQYL